MDKIKNYQEKIKDVLNNYVLLHNNTNDPVKTYLVADDQHGGCTKLCRNDLTPDPSPKERGAFQGVEGPLSSGEGVGGEVKIGKVSYTQHGQYLLIDSGWQNDERFYSNYLHISLNNGKLRIERDLTDYDFTSELLAKGISKDDIILEFQAPSKRPFSGFAVS